jgi:hypothetical protein
MSVGGPRTPRQRVEMDTGAVAPRRAAARDDPECERGRLHRPPHLQAEDGDKLTAPRALALAGVNNWLDGSFRLTSGGMAATTSTLRR